MGNSIGLSNDRLSDYENSQLCAHVVLEFKVVCCPPTRSLCTSSTTMLGAKIRNAQDDGLLLTTISGKEKLQ